MSWFTSYLMPFSSSAPRAAAVPESEVEIPMLTVPDPPFADAPAALALWLPELLQAANNAELLNAMAARRSARLLVMVLL
ncbi:MAG: hypothetical protein M0Z63_06655 [Actinomycetota bacterium]|nr:hypothetical protein [Actinomycetota bacterium]